MKTPGSNVRFAAIVLAAGVSRRMGKPKALLPLGDWPVLAHTLVRVAAVRPIAPIVVVTGHQREEIERVARPFGVQIVHNDRYEAGEMLSSVQTGLAALQNKADAIFIVLGDQPLVRQETFKVMIDAWSERRPMVILPSFQGRHGHPILVSATGIDEIRSLPADATLKNFVDRHRAQSVTLEVADAGILFDIDTPADYEKALSEV